MSALRIEVVEDERMLEEWRHVHNSVVPPAAMSTAEAQERRGRNRLENAYVEGLLVGCSTIRPPRPEDGAVTVIARILPEYRRRGHGTALYAHCLAHARASGADRIETVVLAANADGLRFAEKHGFTELDRYTVAGQDDEWIDLRLTLED